MGFVMSRGRRTSLLLRLVPLLLVPAMLMASTFPGEFRVSASYWALSMAAAIAFAAGWRWPVQSSLVVSALAIPLFAAQAWGLSGLVPYLGAVAVADVAGRCRRNRAVGAAAWWATALLLGNWLDGHTPLWNAVNAVTVVAAVGLPVLLGFYLRAQRRLAALYRERAADAELRRAAAESAARADERAAMARELHDLVAHHMASIVLRIGVAEHVLGGGDPRVAGVLADVHHTAADALADIRRLQSTLREASTDVVVIEPDAVWTEIDAAVSRTRAAGFTVAAQIERGAVELDALARLTLLRVTQEALTNVMKHALASGPVELAISPGDGGISVRVGSTRADGSSPNAEGHGLVGMSERLNLVGGRLDVRRGAGEWVVSAWVPATAVAEARR